MRNIVVILLIIIICVTKKSYYFFFSIQCYLKKKKNSLEFSHKTHQNKKTAPSAPQHPTFSKKICPVELGDQAKTLCLSNYLGHSQCVLAYGKHPLQILQALIVKPSTSFLLHNRHTFILELRLRPHLMA